MKNEKNSLEDSEKMEFQRISELKQEYHRQTELLKPIKYEKIKIPNCKNDSPELNEKFIVKEFMLPDENEPLRIK
jgi:hypothetical protein